MDSNIILWAKSTARGKDGSILNVSPSFHVGGAFIHCSKLMDFIIINLQFSVAYTMYRGNCNLKGSDDGIYTQNHRVSGLCPSSGIENK
jgi:hypothetical protein